MKKDEIISSISGFIRNTVILALFSFNRQSDKIRVDKVREEEDKHRVRRSEKARTLNKQVKNSPLFQKRRKLKIGKSNER